MGASPEVDYGMDNPLGIQGGRDVIDLRQVVIRRIERHRHRRQAPDGRFHASRERARIGQVVTYVSVRVDPRHPLDNIIPKKPHTAPPISFIPSARAIRPGAVTPSSFVTRICIFHNQT